LHTEPTINERSEVPRKHEADEKTNSPLVAAPTDQSAEPKQQGLRDLFGSDFNLPSLDRTLTVTVGEGSDTLTLDVEFRILSSIAANSDFIAVYIPMTTDPIPVCRYFADACQQIYDELKAPILASARNPGDPNAGKSKNLVFSRRIYLYHENEISLEQMSVLSASYRARELDVQFRGPAYRETRSQQQLATPVRKQ
ncbi:MAG TPA: hypothetical protein VKU84_18605, partial [Stellaceae bacterium]|nr:hypothetical protein [Stellaceae bacterium]